MTMKLGPAEASDFTSVRQRPGAAYQVVDVLRCSPSDVREIETLVSTALFTGVIGGWVAITGAVQPLSRSSNAVASATSKRRKTAAAPAPPARTTRQRVRDGRTAVGRAVTPGRLAAGAAVTP